MTKKTLAERVLEWRKKSGLNQSDFWSKYGVTQSGGSRYESGRTIPRSTRLLIWLRETGRITDDDLADAKKALARL